MGADQLSAMFSDGEIAARFGEDHRAISMVLVTQKEITAGVNPGDHRALYHMVGALKPKRVLEIGTHTGTSLIYIASALRAFAPGAGIISTDIVDVNGPNAPWRKLGLPFSPAGACSALGLDPVVAFATTTATQKLAEQSGSYDLIFLDGDHSPVAVYNEISSSLERLNPGGLILLHDYYPTGRPIRGPRAGVERMVAEAPDTAVLPLGNLPWPTKKDSHLTSLALVMRR